ncbi:uncharacterized protein TM35_000461260 [Trypanosoma theileri]|uniref:Uncharacterized protein n=1 Tax=Trypanosoma theileri TaxID=67003 RepID=A0A1X0NI30_9TRYP|nr:uncharacterized protein TM35_000461260 [Trypanosoma theileri]ORC84307.1 hypothetical protein TM35_000461260 [Trypanosoma theileri]
MATRYVSGSQTTNIYREILFAGFPPRGEEKFSPAFVRGFFAHYGSVQNFLFDTERGIGSVTFATSEIAVNCYLAVHLSLLPTPDNANSHEDKNSKGDNVYLLYMEFAQSCPFVNPKLLLLGDMSRYLLRHGKQKIMKRINTSTERNHTGMAGAVASHIVVLWRDSDENDEKTTTEKGQLVRDGPNFPVEAEDVPEVLTEALWSVLKPSGDSIASGDAVTVLDLWWEFYHRYVLHKTEPEASRIKDPYLKYAQKATVAQEIYKVLKTSKRDAYGDEEEAIAVIKRLMHDDVYHSVCGYLMFKLQFHIDPSWASLVRDVTSGTAAATAFQAAKRKNNTTTNHSNNNNSDDDYDDREEEEAEKALLKMPLLPAASNVIENVRFLRAVRRGASVDHLHEDSNTESSEKRTHTTISSTRLDEEDLYMEILHTIDGFAPYGNAAALMSICESPQTFRNTPGHIGWSEVHNKKTGTSSWWVIFQAMTFVLIVLALTAWGATSLATWLGLIKEDGPNTIGRMGGYSQPGDVYDTLPAHVKRKVNIQLARL